MTLEEANALHRYWTKRRNETDTRNDKFRGYVLEVKKYESIIRKMLTPTK